jgi:hypothetical protein
VLLTVTAPALPLFAIHELAAVDTTGSGIDVGVLAQYGVLGVVTTLLLWFARSAIQRERDRADRLEEDNKRLNALILERVIPALTSATRAIEESGELLNALQRERDRELVRLERRRPKGDDG